MSPREEPCLLVTKAVSGEEILRIQPEDLPGKSVTLTWKSKMIYFGLSPLTPTGANEGL